MKLNTVNVVEKPENFAYIHSFTDDEEGNKQAEELFKKILQENTDLTEKEVDEYIMDGVYCDGSEYEVLIIHSM